MKQDENSFAEDFAESIKLFAKDSVSMSAMFSY